LKANRL